MIITDVQPTPNPDAVKVVVHTTLTPDGVALTADEHPEHPLVKALMLRTSVRDVFLQGKEITIVFDSNIANDGREELRWVGSQIRNLSSDVVLGYDNLSVYESDDPTVLLIAEMLEAEVLPFLRSHGGSVRVIAVEGTEVLLRYLGACGGCPSSMTGTLDAITTLIQREIDPNLRIRLV